VPDEVVGEISRDFQVQPMIPFPRNPHFVSREAEMARLQNFLNPSDTDKDRRQVASVVGLLGSGKTQLALEYAYSRKDDFTSIFWIMAKSRQSAERSFCAIAQHLLEHYKSHTAGSSIDIAHTLSLPTISSDGRLQSYLESPTATIHAVKEWLARKGNTGWLLIFDDLDSPEVMDFVPDTLAGHTIITTRSREFASLSKMIEISGVTRKEGVELLRKECKISPRTLSQKGQYLRN
jgi:hypothetical protein